MPCFGQALSSRMTFYLAAASATIQLRYPSFEGASAISAPAGAIGAGLPRRPACARPVPWLWLFGLRSRKSGCEGVRSRAGELQLRVSGVASRLELCLSWALSASVTLQRGRWSLRL